MFIGGLIWGLQLNGWVAGLLRRVGRVETHIDKVNQSMEALALNNAKTALILEQLQKEIQANQDRTNRHLEDAKGLETRLIRVEEKLKNAP